MEINCNFKSKVIKIQSEVISKKYSLTFCELVSLKVRVPGVYLIRKQLVLWLPFPHAPSPSFPPEIWLCNFYLRYLVLTLLSITKKFRSLFLQITVIICRWLLGAVRKCYCKTCFKFLHLVSSPSIPVGPSISCRYCLKIMSIMLRVLMQFYLYCEKLCPQISIYRSTGLTN